MEKIERFLAKSGVACASSATFGLSDSSGQYVILTSGGVKEEGEAFVWSSSEESAVHQYLAYLKVFLLGRGVVIWRVKPTLTRNPELGPSGEPRAEWVVYSRLTGYPKEIYRGS